MPTKPPIGIGIVGAGWMGATLLRRFVEHPDARVAALHQRRRGNAEATLAAAGLPAELYRASYEDLLAAPGVDAVVLCSPNAHHGPQSLRALEAGKHVFCEKPCATRFDEFVHQIKAAEARPDLVTYVNYLMNFDTLEQRILEMSGGGAFGEITQIQVNYRHPINIADDKAWKLDASLMGDAIGMGIIHALSVMLNIMAAQGARPVQVFATRCATRTRPFEAVPIYNIQILFDSGATGFCFGNIDQANGYDAGHNIHGTRGGLIFDSYLDRPQKVRYWSSDRTDGRWIHPLDRERCRRDGVDHLAWPEETTTPDSGNVVDHQTGACVDHFLGCIRDGRQSPLSFTASAPTAEVGWAALMSAERNLPVPLPLDHGDALGFFGSLKSTL